MVSCGLISLHVSYSTYQNHAKLIYARNFEFGQSFERPLMVVKTKSKNIMAQV